DVDDVGVLEPGRGLRLDLEACERLVVRQLTGADHLEGHGAVQPGLAGAVDDAHAAATEVAEDLIAGDLWDALRLLARLAASLVRAGAGMVGGGSRRRELRNGGGRRRTFRSLGSGDQRMTTRGATGCFVFWIEEA